MFVELVRFFVVVLITAVGYQIGNSNSIALPPAFRLDGTGAFALAVMGAAVGYVCGGVIGRFLSRGFGSLEEKVERVPASTVLIGSVGALIGAAGGALASMPILLLVSAVWSAPLSALTIFLPAVLGYRVACRKSNDILNLMGLTRAPLVRSSVNGGSSEDETGILLDSSAVIDGRLLALARTGFLRGPLLLPRFVLEEIQGIADASDPSRRRRGRRGLEILEVLRQETDLLIVDDDLPEFEAIDAKLVQLALRMPAALITTDHNLMRVAELQGVTVKNVNRLVEAVRPPYVAGDQVTIHIDTAGREYEQGVGYADDGTMVIVSGASGEVGENVDAIVTSVHQTAVGRMVFARKIDPNEKGFVDKDRESNEDSNRESAATLRSVKDINS